MCILIYAVMAIVLLICGMYLYANLGIYFSKTLSADEMADARIMFLILMVSISATVLGRAFIGINAGYEHYIFTKISYSLSEILKVIAIVAVLWMGYRAISIVCVEALINLLILLANAGYALLVLKIRIKLHHWDWELFLELIRFAFWTFLAAIVLQINFRLGNVLLGAMAGTSLVGVYAIALQINTIYNTVPTTISGVFLPLITRMVVDQENGDTLTRAIIGPSRYQLMLLGLMLSGFVLFGRQFISLWAGPEYVGAWGAALFILIPVTIPLCQNTILSVLHAQSKNMPRALITLGFAVLCGIISVFLIRKFGLYGPAIATGAALLLGHGVVMNLYYHYIIGLNMRLFFIKVTERILPASILATGIGVSLLWWLPVGNGWGGLVVRIVIYGMLYSGLMWLFGMKENERIFFRTSFSKGIGLLFPHPCVGE